MHQVHRKYLIFEKKANIAKQLSASLFINGWHLVPPKVFETISRAQDINYSHSVLHYCKNNLLCFPFQWGGGGQVGWTTQAHRL